MPNNDFIGNGNNQNSSSETNSNVNVNIDNVEELNLLRSIDSTLKKIYIEGSSMSQSNIRNSMPGRQFESGYSNSDRWKTNRRTKNGFQMGKSDGSQFKGVLDEFEDGLREALMESLLGSGFKENLSKHVEAFEKEFGVNLKDVPKALGKNLGKKAFDAVKGKLPGGIANSVSNIKNSTSSRLYNAFRDGMSTKGQEALDRAMQAAKSQSSSGLNSSPSSNDIGQGDTSTGVTIAQYDLISAIAANVEIIAKNTLKEDSDPTKIASMDDLKNKAQEQAKNVLKDKAEDLVKDAVGMDDVVNGAISALKVLPPEVAILAAGVAIVAYRLTKALAPAIEATAEMFKSMGKAANRYQESRKKNLEEEKKRIEADVDTLIRAPFELLNDAAQAWYDAWDNNLRTITGTQGYNKDSLYDLMGEYAERLRDEGLTAVISSSDITTNLANVLESGLSGRVAEEFAYLATKLNAAVPTQDFFSYGETYASIAANAIKNGQSEAEAISYANEQMELFASNVLYASRQLSGGFSSGLKDAQSIFESSVKIATASKVGQASDISGVLTSVASIVGAIAPDLSSGLVEAVVNAATGGNSSEYVALRSLAGVNASNTEFLRLLAQNPQAIFSELFSNLADLQNMSNANYMEVAEGLSSIFGISMDAFARVDFNYLADAISSMNVNNTSLQENMKLLASGETTTNQEQLKMQQINKYMLDEGLSYVLDNQAARSIQEHMWDEQLARELMEASYAVELQGSALSFLEGISQTVENIINLINPFSFLKKATNLVATAQESRAQRADIRQLLELGKVGNGNARALYNLTTTGQNLNLTPSLISLMGGHSLYGAVSDSLQAFNTLTSFTGKMDLLKAGDSAIKSIVQTAVTGGISSTFGRGRTSRYDWNTVGKSTNSALAALSFTDNLPALASTLSSSASANTRSQNRFQEYLDSMSKFVENNQTYEDWKSSATKYGIKDFETALEDNGLTEAQLKGNFQSQEVKKASEYNHKRDETEDNFWEQGVIFWTVTHPEWEKKVTTLQEQQVAHQVTMLGKIDSLYSLNNAFFENLKAKWDAEFVAHSNYKPEISLDEVTRIQNEEKNGTGDAVLALANALTANDVNLNDPTVQTNVLLSKILLVAEAIMQQNNQGGGGSSLATTLAGLGLGLTQQV